jgi:hypothetical protein
MTRRRTDLALHAHRLNGDETTTCVMSLWSYFADDPYCVRVRIQNPDQPGREHTIHFERQMLDEVTLWAEAGHEAGTVQMYRLIGRYGDEIQLCARDEGCWFLSTAAVAAFHDSVRKVRANPVLTGDEMEAELETWLGVNS